MIRLAGTCRIAVLCLVAALCAGVGAAQMPAPPNLIPGTTHSPDEFGTRDYTVTTIPCFQFKAVPDVGSTEIVTGTPYHCFMSPYNIGGWFLGSVNIPSGSVIDFLGLVSSTSAHNNTFLVNLLLQDQFGAMTPIITVGSTVHGPQTDYNPSAAAYHLIQNIHNELVVEVHQNAHFDPGFTAEFFFVEIWWRRAVSPDPATATFDDVPVGHPQHQFVEALVAAGITAGCNVAPPLYCPDEPVTRGQMAVYLAVALGLHWPF